MTRDEIMLAVIGLLAGLILGIGLTVLLSGDPKANQPAVTVSGGMPVCTGDVPEPVVPCVNP